MWCRWKWLNLLQRFVLNFLISTLVRIILKIITWFSYLHYYMQPYLYPIYLFHEGAYRESRKGPLVITFEGKVRGVWSWIYTCFDIECDVFGEYREFLQDKARNAAAAAAEALCKKFHPGAFSEIDWYKARCSDEMTIKVWFMDKRKWNQNEYVRKNSL